MAKVMECKTGKESTYMRRATEWEILPGLHGHPYVVAFHHTFFGPLTCLELAKLVLVMYVCYFDL
jgi:hypothetical protein